MKRLLTTWLLVLCATLLWAQPRAYQGGNGKWGFRDKNGNWAIQPKYDAVDNLYAFTNNRNHAVVKVGNLWGCINEQGQFITQPVLRTNKMASDAGLAIQKKSSTEGLYDGYDLQKRLWGFTNPNGQFLIPPTFDEIDSETSFRTGKNYAVVKKSGYWGAIDSKGFLLVKPYMLSKEDARKAAAEAEQFAEPGRNIYTAYDPGVVSISREEILRRDYFELAVGIDVGGTDATAVTLAGLTADRREIILMDGLYHRQGIDDRMSESDYIAVIIRFLKRWVNWKPYPGVIWVDSANKLFRTGLAHEMERQGMNRFVVRAFDKQDGINSRIELNEMLMVQGRFRVAEHLKEWHEAYQMAVWDESAYAKSSWVRLDDGSYPLDCLDSAEYAFYNFRRYVEEN